MLSDFPELENAFNLLKENPDIKKDSKADHILATMFIEANGILDKTDKCKVSGALVSLGAFSVFSTALRKRKYATTETKPCRWMGENTENQVNELNKIMRNAFILSLQNKCELKSND